MCLWLIPSGGLLRPIHHIVTVIKIIKIIKGKPSDLDLVLTGRDVKEEIVELADLVTEMKEIKHPFKSGIKAKKGIDF